MPMAVTAERKKHGVGGAWGGERGRSEGAKEQRSKGGKEGKSIWHIWGKGGADSIGLCCFIEFRF